VIGFYERSQNYNSRRLASSYLSVCPSVRVEQLGSPHWTWFSWNVIFHGFLEKFIEDISCFISTWQGRRALYPTPYANCENYLQIYLSMNFSQNDKNLSRTFPVSLERETDGGHFTQRPMQILKIIYKFIYLWISLRMTKICRGHFPFH